MKWVYKMGDLEYNKNMMMQEGFVEYMKLGEKKISSEAIFDGNILHVRRDSIELPNGKPATREYVRHIGAVAVLPLTDEGEVVLERQYRYPFGEILIEIPAGKLESPEEDPRKAALRELAEETGADADELVYLGDYYASPAILDERIRLYLARGLTFRTPHTDEDEFLEVFRMPLEELVREVVAGNIPDGKTQVCAMRVYHMFKNEEEEHKHETQL